MVQRACQAIHICRRARGTYHRKNYTYIIYIYLLHTTVHFPITRSVRYQTILNTLYFMLHRACVLNNIVLTTALKFLKLNYGRVGKRSVERVWYVINNLLHLVIVKYGVISLVFCISTRLRLVTILTILMKYLIICDRL